MAILSLEDLGLPEGFEGTTPGGESIEVSIDYSEALEAFIDTFLDEAESLVPIDTGYLKSTLSGETDGATTATVVTECEYAEYVEFGTWKMAAQPYFEPALDIAFTEFAIEATSLVEEAYQEFEDMMHEAVELEQQELKATDSDIESDYGGFNFGGGGLMGTLLNLLSTLAIAFVTALIQYLSEMITGQSNTKIKGVSQTNISELRPPIEII